MTVRPKKIGFLVLGGIHQILHFIPGSGEMQSKYDYEVVIYVRSQEEAHMCRDILRSLNLPVPEIDILKAPNWKTRVSPKLGILFHNLKTLRQLDILVVAERTSTLPLRLKMKMPSMILVQHGAGDRAGGYNWRIRLFDHVICHGEKDQKRMIELGHVTTKTCTPGGYQKAYALRKMNRTLPILFPDDKPVVFYNPHFELSLSSFNTYASGVLEAFKNQDKYNLIFAPHIRLFSEKSEKEKEPWVDYHQRPNIHVDLGSPMCTDMTYTRMADAYMGDISSQVYEFLIDPGPCVFLANEPFDWAMDESYTHWQFGPVCEHPEDVLATVDRAFEGHSQFIDTQIRIRNLSIGEPDFNAPLKCAQIIHEFISTRS